MRDLEVKLRLLRGVGWGLPEYFRNDKSDSSPEFKFVNRYFADLFAGQAAAVLRAYDARRHENYDPSRPTIEAVDAINLAASLLSHCSVLLQVWQRNLVAVCDLEIDGSEKMVAELAPIRLLFPIAYEPKFVVDQTLRELRFSIEGLNGVQLCMHGRRLFLAGLYLAIFQPANWANEIHSLVRATTQTLINRIERSNNPNYDELAKFISDQCVQSTRWRLDWLDHELAPSNYGNTCLQLDASDGGQVSDLSQLVAHCLPPEKAAHETFVLRHHVGFLEQLVPLRIGALGNPNWHHKLGKLVNDHVEGWGYYFSASMSLNDLRDHDLVLIDPKLTETEEWSRFEDAVKNADGRSDVRRLRLAVLGNKSMDSAIPAISARPASVVPHSIRPAFHDVPTVLAQLVCYPLRRTSIETDEADSIVGQYATLERIRAVVNLANHLLDRAMAIGSMHDRLATTWINEHSQVRIVESLKFAISKVLARPYAPAFKLPSNFADVADSCRFVVSWLFKATLQEPAESNLQLHLEIDKVCQYPWMVLTYVVLVMDINDAYRSEKSGESVIRFRKKLEPLKAHREPVDVENGVEEHQLGAAIWAGLAVQHGLNVHAIILGLQEIVALVRKYSASDIELKAEPHSYVLRLAHHSTNKAAVAASAATANASNV